MSYMRAPHAAALLLVAAGFGLCCPSVAHAGTVSGTIYDVDYLRAQQGGFLGVSYPRYMDPNGNVTDTGSLGQMVYPSNAGNIWSNENVYAFVVDIDSGNVAAAQEVVTNGSSDQGRFRYSFSYLPPGTHHLMFIEPYRGEVYTPSSKRLTATVPGDDSAVSGADISLSHQWRLASQVVTIPGTHYTTSTSITGVSTDFLTKDMGWVAVATDNGVASGPAGTLSRYAVDVYRTLDGGNNWTRVAHVPAPVINDFGPSDIGFMTPPQYGIHFSDAQHGSLLAQANWNFFFWGNGLVPLVTSDGGSTWSISGDTSGTTTASWSDPTQITATSTLLGATELFVNDWYGSFTAEVSWDPSDRRKGVIYGPSGGDPMSYTRVTTDGGQTWHTGKALAGGPDVGASTGLPLQLFTFSGSNFATLSSYNNGTFLTDTTSSWLPLQDTNGNAFFIASGPYTTGRASGQSAISLLAGSDGKQHFYRTDSGGSSWRQLSFFNGGDSYGGSLAHSFSFLSTEASLQEDNSVWLWGPSQTDGTGRSLDGCLSSSYTGTLGMLPNYSLNHAGQHDASPDIHTGRRVLLMDPAYYVSTVPMESVLCLDLDEETPIGPASIMPLIQYQGYHYNAGPGLYVNLTNVGGDWAKNVTIDSIQATNGVVFDMPQPLPWNVGAIPPGSTTNQAANDADPGLIYFPLHNATVPSGVTRFRVTVSGHYNDGQAFQWMQYIRP